MIKTKTMNGTGKINLMKNTLIKIILLSVLFYSCEKESSLNNGEGEAQLNFTISTDYDYSELEKSDGKIADASRKTSSDKSIVDRQTFQFSEDIFVTTELSLSKVNNKNNSINTSVKNLSQDSKQAVVIKEPLKNKSKYKILVYLNNVYVTEKDFIHGSETTSTPIQLDAGKKYTFVAYSVNSESELPAPLNKELLTTASLAGAKGDLVYTKSDLQLVAGNNNLKLNLKHLFSELTIVASTGSFGGKIESVSGIKFSTSRISSNLKLSDGSLTYNANTEDKIITFPESSFNLAKAISNPGIIISPTVSNGRITIEKLKINGLEKPLTIENLPIEPGKKYNLNITVNAPCTQEVNIQNFNLTNGESKTFTAPPSYYGFIFDVHYLDNSLNLVINGQPLLRRNFWEERYENTGWIIPNWQWVQKVYRTEAYDFQFVDLHTDVPPLVQNIRFKSDGKRWGIKYNGSTTPEIPEIYFVKGDKDHPIFRIHIQQDGIIKLYASRKDYGPLEEVEVWTEKRGPIYNNDFKSSIRYYYQAFLNTNVVWNKTTNNTVVATQVNSGPTNMIGRAYGRQRINCAN